MGGKLPGEVTNTFFLKNSRKRSTHLVCSRLNLNPRLSQHAINIIPTPLNGKRLLEILQKASTQKAVFKIKDMLTEWNDDSTQVNKE
jgi:hypothetical protein